MLRIFVDSGSSIKQDEKEKYNIDIIPLIITMKAVSNTQLTLPTNSLV